jgi:hypothetical protein
MQSVFAAIRAKLFQLNAILQGFLVFLGVIVCFFANGAFQFDQIILRHIYNLIFLS